MADATGWSWFADPANANPPNADPAGPGGSDDPAPSFARCFAGPDGERVLAVLRAMTLGRSLGPDAPDAALRHLEGQRALVATILALAARGRGTPSSP